MRRYSLISMFLPLDLRFKMYFRLLMCGISSMASRKEFSSTSPHFLSLFLARLLFVAVLLKLGAVIDWVYVGEAWGRHCGCQGRGRGVDGGGGGRG